MSDAIIPLEGFTFGCDPELFILDGDGNPVSAEGIIPGTKEEPYKVEFGAVQRDGLAAEFNIDPATNFRDFNRNISAVMGQLTKMIPKGYKLEAVPSVRFNEKIFAAADPEALMLGCQPDLNAWEMTDNPPPSLDNDPFLRCAGGHLHIGWTTGASVIDPQHVLNATDLVKQLDWYLGGWSIKQDENTERRSLYGKAGACRIKDYGVEYRVLSNFWVTTPAKRQAVWDRMNQAIIDMKTCFIPERTNKATGLALVNSINNSVLSQNMSRNYKFPLSTIDHSYARF